MKKAIKFLSFLFLAGIMTTTISCSSDDGEGGGSGLSEAWKIDGRTFNQAFCMSEEDDDDGTFNLFAIDDTYMVDDETGEVTSGSLIAVIFPAKPTSNGTYNLKNGEDFENGDVDDLAPNEALVVFREVINGVEYDQMIKNTGSTVSVTVSNGKVSVTVPEMDAYRYENNGEAYDLDQLPVVKVEGNIVETGLPGGGRAFKKPNFKIFNK